MFQNYKKQWFWSFLSSSCISTSVGNDTTVELFLFDDQKIEDQVFQNQTILGSIKILLPKKARSKSTFFRLDRKKTISTKQTFIFLMPIYTGRMTNDGVPCLVPGVVQDLYYR